MLGAVLVASQVGSWAHEAVVSHVTCLEHGESLHAGAPSAREASTWAGEGARLGRLPAAEQGHEHCAGGAFLRARGAVLPGPVATGRLALFSIATPSCDGARPAIVAGRVYRQAPKTSPPSARA